MAITIKTGIVNKRKNSTYVPTTELVNSYDVVLKESCSDYAPTFFLNNPTNTFNDNYLQWGDWYYFIDDVIREKNHAVTLRCKLDPLATYKANIIGSTQFVAYDTSANSEVIDTRLSVNTTPTVSVNSDSAGSFFETGCILLGCVGTGNTGTFVVSLSQLKSILGSINTTFLDDSDMVPLPSGGFSFNDLTEAAEKAVYNMTVGIRQLVATGKAPDSIKSCLFVAVPGSAFTGTNERVWLGDFDTHIDAKLLAPTSRATETHTISIPWNFSDWRRNTPYTNIYLKLPYVGLIPISPSEIMGADSIGITTFVTQTGDISHLVYANSLGGHNVFIGKYGGNCASNILVGASGLNPFNIVAGGAALTAGSIAASVNPLVAGAAAIAGFTGAIIPLTATAGSGGGGAFTDDPIYSVIALSHNTNVDPASVSVFMGTPTMAVKSLTGLSGYVECRNASVSAPTSESMIQEINNYLNGGVYLE